MVGGGGGGEERKKQGAGHGEQSQHWSLSFPHLYCSNLNCMTPHMSVKQIRILFMSLHGT